MWQIGNKILNPHKRPLVMGILNITPDSFSDGGLFLAQDQALSHARELIHAGADIIDIGGESTRPGALPVPPDEEISRILPVIHSLIREAPDTLLSIDTRHAETAQEVLSAGAHIINDINGLNDPAMIEVCASSSCGLVVMHMQGTPQTMQDAPAYTDIISHINDFFAERLRTLQSAGIVPTRIALDPGIGFGKTIEHNVTILHELPAFLTHNRPLLMGLSRKRFLGALLEDPDYARTHSTATLTATLYAQERGASIHRVHDVKEIAMALKLFSKLNTPLSDV